MILTCDYCGKEFNGLKVPKTIIARQYGTSVVNLHRF